MNDTLPRSPSKSRRRVAVAALGFAAFMIAAWGIFRGSLDRQREKEWMRQVEAAGGKVYRTGYATSPMARVPILGQLFMHSSLAVFIPNSEAGRAVLPLLPGRPKLGRIWVHRDNVSQDVIDRLKRACPGTEFTRYT